MSMFCRRARCHAATEMITPAVIMKAAKRVCGNAASATGLVSTARKSVISAREPSPAILNPTGFCMNAFAARMKYAENQAPIVAIQMLARCSALGSLSQPKIHSPMNVASKKKAMRPSNARGAPNTSPTKREYDDQFMPNWNSCTMPVTTPMAKLIRKILPKNRVRWSHFSVAGAIPGRLEDRDGERHPERQRNEEEMVERREAELPAGEEQRVQQIHDTSPIVHYDLWSDHTVARGLTTRRQGLEDPA